MNKIANSGALFGGTNRGPKMNGASNITFGLTWIIAALLVILCLSSSRAQIVEGKKIAYYS